MLVTCGGFDNVPIVLAASGNAEQVLGTCGGFVGAANEPDAYVGFANIGRVLKTCGTSGNFAKEAITLDVWCAFASDAVVLDTCASFIDEVTAVFGAEDEQPDTHGFADVFGELEEELLIVFNVDKTASYVFADEKNPVTLGISIVISCNGGLLDFELFFPSSSTPKSFNNSLTEDHSSTDDAGTDFECDFELFFPSYFLSSSFFVLRS